MKAIYFSLFFILLSLSCRKESMQIPGNSSVPIISKINVGDQPANQFIHDDYNLIKEEKSKIYYITHRYNNLNQLQITDYYGSDSLPGNDPRVLEIALNSRGLLNYVDSKKEASLLYEYDTEGKLIRTKFSTVTTSSREYSEFSYDVNGRIGRQTLYWDNKQAGYILYVYDGKGNLINEKVYSVSPEGVAELNTTTRFEFDNYQNPFRAFYKLMAPGINTNPNNITKETYTIHFKPGQGTDIVQETQTSYTYNSKGYPVRKNGTVDYIYE